ncbi:MAG: GHKL domain-containing protein [Proteobacteria bacterium]|nr:GHKL domain-containing protein [Pseudomonadota bacterium]
MKGLIQHLLTLSRVGTQGKEFVPVEPRRVIDSVLEDFSEHINKTGAEVDVQQDLPTVVADDLQLGELFQNLIGNALKFMPEGRTPKIAVSARVQGGEAVFSVEDNGIGIAEEYWEKIFGVFQRLHRKEQYEGVGIGLALCQKIVQRHGGKIWVESEVGKRSTFHFTLKRISETKEEQA